jgi:hypothetical protein
MQLQAKVPDPFLVHDLSLGFNLQDSKSSTSDRINSFQSGILIRSGDHCYHLYQIKEVLSHMLCFRHMQLQAKVPDPFLVHDLSLGL